MNSKQKGNVFFASFWQSHILCSGTFHFFSFSFFQSNLFHVLGISLYVN